MSDLDEAWALALAEAEKRARLVGRTEISEYLALRNSNDLLRTTATKWLLDTFLALAAEANRSGAAISISRDDSHRFRVGSSTMVGTSLSMSFGVRKLIVASGWPRTPSDGFVRGGGLAAGHISHLGIKEADQELLLVRSADTTPKWLIKGKRGTSKADESALRRHIFILCDKS